MNDKVFLDTNILIYLYSADELHKQTVVDQIIQTHEVIVSTQVLNEFINVMTKKYKLELAEITRATLEITESFTIAQVTTDTIMLALSMARKYRFSYFDSLIIASALQSECTILYTEDLHNQQLIENSLLVNNPFK